VFHVLPVQADPPALNVEQERMDHIHRRFVAGEDCRPRRLQARSSQARLLADLDDRPVLRFLASLEVPRHRRPTAWEAADLPASTHDEDSALIPQDGGHHGTAPHVGQLDDAPVSVDGDPIAGLEPADIDAIDHGDSG